MRKKQKKQQEYLINQRNKLIEDLDNQGFGYYRSFYIKKCLDNFNSYYYTVVNLKINSHIHANSIGLSLEICDLAKYLLKNPYFSPKKNGHHSGSLATYKRATRLAFRTIERR